MMELKEKSGLGYDRELWKGVVGYEGLYEVSNRGRVRSLDRITTSKRGTPIQFMGKMIKGGKNNIGYPYVGLSNGGHRKNELIHRLVATSFIHNDNPDTHIIVNHIDENIENNYVDNLEWCNHKYNSNYGTSTSRAKETYQKNKKLGKHGDVGKPKTAVRIFDDNGFDKDFNSVYELTEYLDCSRAAVSKVLNGKQNTLRGYFVEKIAA